MRKIGRLTWRNRLLTRTAALMMDSSATLRRRLIDTFMSDDVPLATLLSDPTRSCAMFARPRPAYGTRAGPAGWAPCPTR
ncbi:MAG: hypothetical protein WDN49_17155 [Acetobacteraceae bacterium]